MFFGGELAVSIAFDAVVDVGVDDELIRVLGAGIGGGGDFGDEIPTLADELGVVVVAGTLVDFITSCCLTELPFVATGLVCFFGETFFCPFDEAIGVPVTFEHVIEELLLELVDVTVTLAAAAAAAAAAAICCGESLALIEM